jgi:ubiquinone/menaquinone biosynthesis C-methylase UbiE
MSVATHLGIDIADYDARIRTFIPDYDAMLDAGANAVPRGVRTIVDLGVGTGAFAVRCLARAAHARVIGIDSDADILRVAAQRLETHGSFVRGSFLRTALPTCNAVIASFALHHVRTRDAKARLYRRIRSTLAERGRFVSVDCHPSKDRAAARNEMKTWAAHLWRAYSRREADALLKAWSKEDVYVPLESEVELLRRARFDVKVVWRRGSFAVIVARRVR